MRLLKNEAFWLALPVVIGGLWLLYGAMADASYSRARVDSQAAMIQAIHDDVLLIKKDVEFMKERK